VNFIDRVLFFSGISPFTKQKRENTLLLSSLLPKNYTYLKRGRAARVQEDQSKHSLVKYLKTTQRGER
jgi:hypothetical protein